jgi:hypothetical protein
VSLDFILFLDFLKLNCEHVPRTKLYGSTNFIILGPTDQKLWMFENFRRKVGQGKHVLEPRSRS